MATTDFQEFLNYVDPNHHEIYNLYQLVNLRHLYTEKNYDPDTALTDTTPFDIEKGRGRGQYLITYINKSYTPLLLASELAADAFLKAIESSYFPDSDIESWYGFQCAMEDHKDD